MAEYLHPGVYIEETSYRSPPFEGVSTSTAGLVGRTRKGAEGKPTLVTSFTEFVRTFGEPFPIVGGVPPQLGDYLGHAVRAFFDNGGKRAYIVRTLGDNAAPATASLVLGQAYRLPGTTTVRGPTATIPLNTVRGLDGGATPSKLDVYSRAPNGTSTYRFTITVQDVDVTRNSITINPPLGASLTLAPGSTFFLPAGTTLTGVGPKFTALSRGEDGNSISVQIRPADSTAMKLTAQRFFRAFPQIAAFSGQTGNIGPNSGSPATFAATLGVVERGDTLALDGPLPEPAPVVVGDITFSGPTPPPMPTTVTVSGVSASAGPFNAGAAIRLVSRKVGTIDATAPASAAVYVLSGSDTISAVTAATTSVDLPYGALALLHKDDVIEIGGAVQMRLGTEPDFTLHPNAVSVNLANNHPITNITVAATGDIDAGAFVKRLLLADTTGLAAPFGAGGTAQKIAITDGTNTIDADVLLVDGLKNTVVVRGSQAIPAAWTSFELLQVAGASDSVPVASTSGFYTGAVVELFDGTVGDYFLVTGVDPATRQVTLSATPNPITVPSDPNARKAYLRVLELDVLVYENGTLLETFSGLSWNPDPTADSFRRYFVPAINDPDNGSELVSVSWTIPALIDPGTQPNTPDGFPLNLGGGNNGLPLSDSNLIGQDLGPGQRTGIEALKEKMDIALVAVPGVTDESVQQALLTHCELLRYRFAILDGRPGESDITRIEAHRGNYDSLYGGYYTPWLRTLDLQTGNTMLAPPSGYVLGICARVDNTRGVHKAPANEIVQNILDVELPFTDGEQDVLNPLGINLIRAFENRGIRVWGARTTSSDAEWKYVNVRRLFIFLEHSIDNGTQWVVFEPNSESLWERVKESIESFLFGVWKTGALMGTKPEDAYFVRCDRTTMTQDDIDNGRLVCLIGVAPTYPAEFVIFRIGQFTASTKQA